MQVSVGTRCLFSLLVSLLWFGSAKRRPNSSPDPQPKWSVALSDYGWSRPRTESNRAFFKDFSDSKLAALDGRTRLLFVSDDVLVVYHTKQEGDNWRTKKRQLEAFFVKARDGSLLHVSEWPSELRKSIFDTLDTESRLIALHDGRFLVQANGTMMLYGSEFKLIKEQQLQPFNSTNLWAIQIVAAGHEMFLRHQSSSPLRVTYQWLDSDTFRVLREMPGYEDRDFPLAAYVVAADDAVFTASRSGIRVIRPNQPAKTICNDMFCRGDGIPDVFTSNFVGFSGRTGIGVVDAQQGLLWSETLQLGQSPNDFQFGSMRETISGDRFAVWITAHRKTLFDGVEIHSSPTVFVYNVVSPRHIFSISIGHASGDFDFALSPDGTELAVLDGERVKVYITN